MTRMLVTCVGDAGTRFDREYYATTHLALAMRVWGPYGLEAAEAFFPAGAVTDWLSIGVYRFRKPGDVDAALAAPQTREVMDDVRNFTDATVVLRSLFTPLP